MKYLISFLTLTAITALSLPAQAGTSCGSMSGSYRVTCEKGVKVYRHQALSSFSRTTASDVLQREQLALSQKRQAAQAQLQARAQRARLEQAKMQQRAQPRVAVRQRFQTFSGFGGNRFGNSRFGARAGFRGAGVNRPIKRRHVVRKRVK